MTLHYTPLRCITLHYTTFHYTSLHCTTLHSTTLQLQLQLQLHSATLHDINLHYNKLHYTTLHYTALHYIHSTTLHYTGLPHLFFCLMQRSSFFDTCKLCCRPGTCGPHPAKTMIFAAQKFKNYLKNHQEHPAEQHAAMLPSIADAHDSHQTAPTAPRHRAEPPSQRQAHAPQDIKQNVVPTP